MKKPERTLTSYLELEREKKREQRAMVSCRPVQEGLQALMKNLAPTRSQSKKTGIQKVREVWIDAVGVEIARLSTPVRYREGVLTVTVAAAPLASELQAFGEKVLVGELAERGLEGIHTIRFQTGDRPQGRSTGEGHES
ncbi:MAG: DUF721 domain-containing protein [Planctomycetes bacterium]|nr:DUF721 domain-containing protein [Planctomycetota bacterium]MBT6540738.1 DUF721 domain-containing protein [Planctomycetota bacterium]MBT6783402.1 DUF721 domain-containing protein [Planctomycetota bacterium]MBT7129596.1 DUF721 domain-containing protein [Planctomycetota bacterium]